jgi:hypothetical protein
MATRQYRRDSKGKFAGSGGGSMVTYGKAGGFANAAFRARTSATNQRASRGRSFGLGKGAKRALKDVGVGVGVGAGFTALGLAARGARGLSGADRGLALANRMARDANLARELSGTSKSRFVTTGAARTALSRRTAKTPITRRMFQ